MESIHELAKATQETALHILNMWGDGKNLRTSPAGLYIRHSGSSTWIGETHNYAIQIEYGKLKSGDLKDLNNSIMALELMALLFASEDFIHKQKKSIARLKRITRAINE